MNERKHNIDLNWEDLYSINLETLNIKKEEQEMKQNISEELLIQLIELLDVTINPNHNSDIRRITKQYKPIDNKFLKIKVYNEEQEKEDKKLLTYQYSNVVKNGQYVKMLHYQLEPGCNLEELAVIYHGPNYPKLIDKRYNFTKKTYKVNNGKEMPLDNKQLEILYYELINAIESLKELDEIIYSNKGYSRILK